jgi:hypothetical protein
MLLLITISFCAETLLFVQTRLLVQSPRARLTGFARKVVMGLIALPQSAPGEHDVYSLTPLRAVRSGGAQYGVGVEFTFRS